MFTTLKKKKIVYVCISREWWSLYYILVKNKNVIFSNTINFLLGSILESSRSRTKWKI